MRPQPNIRRMEPPSLHSSDSQSISVRWTAVEHAASYTVQFRKSALNGSNELGWLQLPAIKGTVVKKKNLDMESMYYFRIVPNVDGAALTDGVSDGWDFSQPSEALTVCRLPSFVRNLLGPQLVDASRKEVSVDSLAGYTIGVYASASWCGPCRQFTPSLAAFYGEARASGRKFEVVFVSCDRDEASSDAYFSKMPWLAVPYASPAREAALQQLQVPHTKSLFPGSPTCVTCVCCVRRCRAFRASWWWRRTAASSSPTLCRRPSPSPSSTPGPSPPPHRSSPPQRPAAERMGAAAGDAPSSAPCGAVRQGLKVKAPGGSWRRDAEASSLCRVGIGYVQSRVPYSKFPAAARALTKLNLNADWWFLRC